MGRMSELAAELAEIGGPEQEEPDYETYMLDSTAAWDRVRELQTKPYYLRTPEEQAVIDKLYDVASIARKK